MAAGYPVRAETLGRDNAGAPEDGGPLRPGLDVQGGSGVCHGDTMPVVSDVCYHPGA